MEEKQNNSSSQGFIFTIFGGTGNLTYNKLIPAYYELFLEGKINQDSSIISIGRQNMTSENYREELKHILKKRVKGFVDENYEDFKKTIHYFMMDFSKSDDYIKLKEYMVKTDHEHHCFGNRIFYLATAPEFFPLISEQLNNTGFIQSKGYTRAVFEKPFGYDLESATKINDTISKVFEESNIYRIDHYLGKEMIQNILLVRFSNQIFSSVWNNESIDNVQITVKESGGVEERGGYYDKAGALRDMVQNHLLQVLALVAMEPPKEFDTNSIRDEKVKVLMNLKVESHSHEHKKLIFGQYEGYRNESKVSKDSITETYVAMKCIINTERWRGVPFYMRSGKFLDSREAEVIIEFKNKRCCDKINSNSKPNLLVLKIQPEEGIYFRINTKRPRSENELMSVSMDYCQSCNILYKSPEAYERLLIDIINGDMTLFTRWDEVETAWDIISKIDLPEDEKRKYMTSYIGGSTGPKEADQMLENDGRRWWQQSDLQSEFSM